MSSVISRILASIRPLHGRPIVKHSFALLGNKPVEPAQSGGGALYWNVIAWVMWIQLIIWRLIGHQILSPYQTGIYETLLDAQALKGISRLLSYDAIVALEILS